MAATLNLPSLEIPEIEEPKGRKFIKKPDTEARDKAIAQIKARLEKVNQVINDANKQIEVTITPKADIETRNALTAELRTVVKSQGDLKKKKQNVNEQIKIADQTMKKKIAEIQEKSSKHNFKTVEDIEKRIKQLESDIESGAMLLVAEKKAFKEISSLNKLKKDFAGIDQVQKSIDGDKAKINDLKASLNAFSNKEIQAKFEEITNSLDALTTKNKSVNEKRTALFDKRSAAYKERDAIRDEMRSIYDEFDTKFKKFKTDMDNERKKRDEDEKAYRLYLKKRDLIDEIKEIAETAEQPAFANEISQLELFISKFSPDSEKVDESKEETIEIPEGATIIKKSEESFFVGTAKNKKKNKKSKQKKTKFTIDPEFIGALAQYGIAIPSSEADFPEAITSLKEKLATFKDGQEEAQEEIVATAQAKVDKIVERITKLDAEIAEELEKEKAKAEAEAEAESAAQETNEE
ncbi:Bfr1 protein [Martiniozyma asiatica (nom. inval.)]|nr:Bfr1 protein [Martiniozyma asiatica]